MCVSVPLDVRLFFFSFLRLLASAVIDACGWRASFAVWICDRVLCFVRVFFPGSFSLRTSLVTYETVRKRESCDVSRLLYEERLGFGLRSKFWELPGSLRRVWCIRDTVNFGRNSFHYPSNVQYVESTLHKGRTRRGRRQAGRQEDKFKQRLTPKKKKLIN